MAGRLRNSKPDKPGLTRRAAGRGFFYADSDGQRLQDDETIARIKGLVIPPAWKDVWICPWPNGHIQALGTDDAGRRQYLYHPDWRAKQDAGKFERAREFGACLPGVRRTVSRHLSRSQDPQQRCLAAAVRLIDATRMRTGAEEYAAENGSFGATTLLRRHVRISRKTITFEFPGKSGKLWNDTFDDATLAAFLSGLPRRGAESRLLGYPTDSGWSDISRTELNSYLASVAGGTFTAKDFRTWQGTVTAARALARLAAAGHSGEAAEKRAIEVVAEVLNNTPAIARASYVDPLVFELFQQGVTASRKGSADAAVVRLLTGR